MPTLFGRVMSSPWCLNSSQVEGVLGRRPQATPKRGNSTTEPHGCWPFSTSEGRKGERREENYCRPTGFIFSFQKDKRV